MRSTQSNVTVYYRESPTTHELYRVNDENANRNQRSSRFVPIIESHQIVNKPVTTKPFYPVMPSQYHQIKPSLRQSSNFIPSGSSGQLLPYQHRIPLQTIPQPPSNHGYYTTHRFRPTELMHSHSQFVDPSPVLQEPFKPTSHSFPNNYHYSNPTQPPPINSSAPSSSHSPLHHRSTFPQGGGRGVFPPVRGPRYHISTREEYQRATSDILVELAQNLLASIPPSPSPPVVNPLPTTNNTLNPNRQLKPTKPSRRTLPHQQVLPKPPTKIKTPLKPQTRQLSKRRRTIDQIRSSDSEDLVSLPFNSTSILSQQSSHPTASKQFYDVLSMLNRQQFDNKPNKSPRRRKFQHDLDDLDDIDDNADEDSDRRVFQRKSRTSESQRSSHDSSRRSQHSTESNRSITSHNSSQLPPSVLPASFTPEKPRISDTIQQTRQENSRRYSSTNPFSVQPSSSSSNTSFPSSLASTISSLSAQSRSTVNSTTHLSAQSERGPKYQQSLHDLPSNLTQRSDISTHANPKAYKPQQRGMKVDKNTSALFPPFSPIKAASHVHGSRMSSDFSDNNTTSPPTQLPTPQPSTTLTPIIKHLVMFCTGLVKTIADCKNSILSQQRYMAQLEGILATTYDSGNQLRFHLERVDKALVAAKNESVDSGGETLDDDHVKNQLKQINRCMFELTHCVDGMIGYIKLGVQLSRICHWDRSSDNNMKHEDVDNNDDYDDDDQHAIPCPLLLTNGQPFTCPKADYSSHIATNSVTSNTDNESSLQVSFPEIVLQDNRLLANNCDTLEKIHRQSLNHLAHLATDLKAVLNIDVVQAVPGVDNLRNHVEIASNPNHTASINNNLYGFDDEMGFDDLLKSSSKPHTAHPSRSTLDNSSSSQSHLDNANMTTYPPDNNPHSINKTQMTTTTSTGFDHPSIHISADKPESSRGSGSRQSFPSSLSSGGSAPRLDQTILSSIRNQAQQSNMTQPSFPIPSDTRHLSQTGNFQGSNITSQSHPNSNPNPNPHQHFRQSLRATSMLSWTAKYWEDDDLT